MADGIPEKEILMAYISRSCDFPKVKMERWVAYIIKWWDQISFFGNLMAYVSRSCDFPKVKMGRWVAYIIKWCHQITKKGNIKDYVSSFLMLQIPKNPKKIQKIIQKIIYNQTSTEWAIQIPEISENLIKYPFWDFLMP